MGRFPCRLVDPHREREARCHRPSVDDPVDQRVVGEMLLTVGGQREGDSGFAGAGGGAEADDPLLVLDRARVQRLEAAGEQDDRDHPAGENILHFLVGAGTEGLDPDLPRFTEPEGGETGPVHPPGAVIAPPGGDQAAVVIVPLLQRPAGTLAARRAVDRETRHRHDEACHL